MRFVQSSLYVAEENSDSIAPLLRNCCTFPQPIMWVSQGAHMHPPSSSYAHKSCRRQTIPPSTHIVLDYFATAGNG